jgi:hypothetical protein
MQESKLVMTPELVRLDYKLNYLTQRMQTSQFKDERDSLENIANEVRHKIEDLVVAQMEGQPVKSGNLFILSTDGRIENCRFFMHPDARSIDEFDADRLQGDVTGGQIDEEDMDDVLSDFAAQLVRLRAKGYIEVNNVTHYRLNADLTEEL